MAIKKKSPTSEEKLANAVEDLRRDEEENKEKAGKVLKKISGGKNTRVITDAMGRTRTVKVPEKRKAMSLYIPESLYRQFETLTAFYGISKNGQVVKMIRDYVMRHKDMLEEAEREEL